MAAPRLRYTDYPDMIAGPNMDLSNRPQVKNPHTGGISSVWSMSIGVEEKGKEITVLIPRIAPDGKIMTEDEAVAHFRKTGEHMGKFKTIREANRFSRDYSNAVGKKK